MNQKIKLSIGFFCCIILFLSSGCVHHKISPGNCHVIAQTSKVGTFKIQNQWYQGKQLQLQTGKVCSEEVSNETSDQMWVLEQINDSDVYRIKSFSNPSLYLNIEYGKLECSEINNGWLSAQWIVTKYQGSVRIQNVWKLDNYLNMENDILECSPILFNWQSAKWDLIRII